MRGRASKALKSYGGSLVVDNDLYAAKSALRTFGPRKQAPPLNLNPPEIVIRAFHIIMNPFLLESNQYIVNWCTYSLVVLI